MRGKDAETLEDVIIKRFEQVDTLIVENEKKTKDIDDLKEDKEHVHFTGTVIYKKTIQVAQPDETIINLGNVQGISDRTAFESG